jgi:hypothetical protein
MDELALARWQGAIDERTKVIERRMDSLNGDVRMIRHDIGEIKQTLRDAAITTKATQEQRARWLAGWRLRLLILGAVTAPAGVIVNVVLNALGLTH